MAKKKKKMFSYYKVELCTANGGNRSMASRAATLLLSQISITNYISKPQNV